MVNDPNISVIEHEYKKLQLFDDIKNRMSLPNHETNNAIS